MMSLVGQQFGPYQVMDYIGGGGMGQVYRARNSRDGREVALKILSQSSNRADEMIKRFQREGNVIAQLRHPNIIDVYEMGFAEGQYYIAMRLIRGETLEARVQRVGRLAPETVLHIVRQLADALDYAHARAIIHRDIKPANIMLDRNDHVILMDFGIAKAPDAQKITFAGERMGTQGYMSPEQAAGRPVDKHTDIYALGMVIQEMLTGKAPYLGGMSAEIPPPARPVIQRCCAFDPQQRYHAGAEVFRALQRGLHQPTRRAEPESGPLKLVLPSGEYALTPGVHTIGRTRENDVVINDRQVSRHHAEIRTSPDGQSVLVDLDSTNGTFLNGHHLTPQMPCPLVANSHVRLGESVKLHVQAGTVRAAARPQTAAFADANDTTLSGSFAPVRSAAEPVCPAPPPSGDARGASYAWIAVALVALSLVLTGVWVAQKSSPDSQSDDAPIPSLARPTATAVPPTPTPAFGPTSTARPTSAPSPTAQAAQVAVSNRTGQQITGIYVVPVKASAWGSNLLDGAISSSGSRTLAGFERGMYDLRAVNADGETVEALYNVSLALGERFAWRVDGPRALPANAVLRYEDDFNDNANSWGDSGDSDTVTYTTPQNGKFCLTIKRENYMAWEWYEPFRTSEFVAEVTCVVEETETTSCGMVYGPDGDNFYWYKVAAGEQQYVLQLQEDDVWQDKLVDWTTSAYINPGGTNRLRMALSDDMLALYINGMLLDEVPAGHFTEQGRIGIGGSAHSTPDVTICFNELRVWRLE
jgi:serine/threonine protein kinase